MVEAADPDLELLAHGYTLYNAHDYDELAKLFAPDIVIQRDGGQPPLHGRDAVRSFMEPDAFEYQYLEPQELSRVGDRVLVRVWIRAKGAGSEIELEMTGWHVWTLGDGVVTRLVATFDEEKARTEAGLL